MLDRAHRGDIEGALGRISSFDVGPRRSSRSRIKTLVVVMGPGLVVMVANNDAGSISTFAQAGQDYGLRWVWLVALLGTALFVIQEMAGRLGTVTGAGHARLIFERFGRRWGAFALVDLIALNFLLVVTELIGLQFGLAYFGVSRFVSVPVAAVGLICLTATGSFRGWERGIYVLVVASAAVLPLLLVVHLYRHGPIPSAVGRHELSGTGVLFALAMVGTTVAPWQLFFQQSNVVDKRITTRWLAYERADTLFGTTVFVIGAVAVIAACAAAFGGTPLHGAFVDAGAVADGIRARAGSWAGGLFALALIDGSILGAAAVTLSTAYAVSDATGMRHSLHRSWREAPTFYGAYGGCVVGAAAVVLLAASSLGVVTLAVQALSGVLFPSAAVFLLLLCNDRDVLGPWVNRWWLNALAGLLVAVLLVLAALSGLNAVFPHLEPTWPAGILCAAGAIALLAVIRPLHKATPATAVPIMSLGDRANWSMPSLESLPRAHPSRARAVGLVTLRVYVGLAVIAVAVKIVRVAVGT